MACRLYGRLNTACTVQVFGGQKAGTLRPSDTASRLLPEIRLCSGTATVRMEGGSGMDSGQEDGIGADTSSPSGRVVKKPRREFDFKM